jgi:penicillin-binding protein 1A
VNFAGEKTDDETGRKDLFSSVAESAAKANGSKWKAEEERKKLEAKAQRDLEASREAMQVLEQTVSSLWSLIREVSALGYRDSLTEEKISTAYLLLDQLAGTEYYDELKTQLYEAANYAESLTKQEDSLEKPREIGPGIPKPKETVPPAFPEDFDPEEEEGPAFGQGGPDSGAEAVGPDID